MNSLRDRIALHAEKVKKTEEMEAALAGVCVQTAQEAEQKFTMLVLDVIKPAFKEFKDALRQLGRDAVIVNHAANGSHKAIGLTLVDRYLSFGAGRTLKLVNPREDLAKNPSTKFYEILAAEDAVHIRVRFDMQLGPISTAVPYGDITRKFVENELALFFERSYPALA